MSAARSTGIAALIATHRPPGAPTREAVALGEIARRWRVALARVMKAVAAGAITLRAGEITELAVAMTELAEDLHTESGLWRAVEGHNHATFGTPLPLVYRVVDPTLDPFDVRRFQFFLYSVWRISNRTGSSRPRTAVSWPLRARPRRFSPPPSPRSPENRL